MLDRIHDLYDELERQKVMLSFKGSLTEDLITALLGLVERKMIAIEPDARARKRVFNVVTECWVRCDCAGADPAAVASAQRSSHELDADGADYGWR